MLQNEAYKKLDLRIRRTHKLLIDALLSLLEEKSFDDIRISDICDRAMVHRTTFYNHFEDKYDLLGFVLKEFLEIINEESIKLTPKNNPRKYYTNIFKLILEHMSENKKMYLMGLKTLKNDPLSRILRKSIVECIQSRLESNEKDGIKFTIPVPILAEFYSATIISLASWWLENDMPISTADMVNYGDKIVANVVKNN